MDQLLYNKLKNLADDLSEDSMEGTILDMSAEDHSDFEELLTTEISTALGLEFKKLVQIRHLFRIIVKYGTDINRGLTRIREYYD